MLTNGIPRLCAAAWAAALLPSMCGAARASDPEYDREPINYSTAEPENAVERLRRRIEAGEAGLRHETGLGYLRSVLRELDVPESSQMLVFSKTSMQRNRITPRRPRALYFNDEVYVGYCQHGEVLELSAADPQLGAVFYTLDQTGPESPRLTRRTDNCLVCHASSSHTDGVPGHVVRSVFPDAAGLPILSAGTYRIDQTSPLSQRWGGWYVTGTHGGQKHLGNLIVRDKAAAPERIDNAAGMNVTDLAGRFDTSAYPTPHSDIVALLVLEHQALVHNLIARANHQTRRALWEEENLDKAFGEPSDELRESTVRRIRHAGEPLVKALLFSGEAQLTDAVAGTSGFQEEFAKRGPRDGRGRSLRDFDLRTRLFKHPCSYLIDSEAFDALPGPVRDHVLRRVLEVLTGQDASADFAHLTAEDRRAVLEILRDTKPDLPEDWKGDKLP